MEEVAGPGELQAELDRYLHQVKAGGTVVVTEHGKPIGRIVPYKQSVNEHLEALQEAGIVRWSGEKLEPLEPLVTPGGSVSIADILLEDRE